MNKLSSTVPAASEKKFLFFEWALGSAAIYGILMLTGKLLLMAGVHLHEVGALSLQSELASKGWVDSVFVYLILGTLYLIAPLVGAAAIGNSSGKAIVWVFITIHAVMAMSLAVACLIH